MVELGIELFKLHLTAWSVSNHNRVFTRCHTAVLISESLGTAYWATFYLTRTSAMIGLAHSSVVQSNQIAFHQARVNVSFGIESTNWVEFGRAFAAQRFVVHPVVGAPVVIYRLTRKYSNQSQNHQS